MSHHPSHEIKFSVRELHPSSSGNMLGAGRCAHVITCRCGTRLEGRGNTKDAARKRADAAHRKHVKDEAARARAVTALFVEDEL